MTSLMDVMFLVLVFFIYCIFDMAVHKGVKVDQVRVPREGRKRLIRRIAKARRAKRQDLPILLPGGSKKIDEAICFVAKRPDAVRRWKRRHRQQNAAAPFHGK